MDSFQLAVSVMAFAFIVHRTLEVRRNVLEARENREYDRIAMERQAILRAKHEADEMSQALRNRFAMMRPDYYEEMYQAVRVLSEEPSLENVKRVEVLAASPPEPEWKMSLPVIPQPGVFTLVDSDAMGYWEMNGFGQRTGRLLPHPTIRNTAEDFKKPIASIVKTPLFDWATDPRFEPTRQLLVRKHGQAYLDQLLLKGKVDQRMIDFANKQQIARQTQRADPDYAMEAETLEMHAHVENDAREQRAHQERALAWERKKLDLKAKYERHRKHSFVCDVCGQTEQHSLDEVAIMADRIGDLWMAHWKATPKGKSAAECDDVMCDGHLRDLAPERR